MGWAEFAQPAGRLPGNFRWWLRQPVSKVSHCGSHLAHQRYKWGRGTDPVVDEPLKCRCEDQVASRPAMHTAGGSFGRTSGGVFINDADFHGTVWFNSAYSWPERRSRK